VRDWPITICWPAGPSVGGVWTWALHFAQHLAQRGRAVRLIVHNWKPDPARQGTCELADLGPGVKPQFDLLYGPPLFDPEQWEASYDFYRKLTPTYILPNLGAQTYAQTAVLAREQPDRIRVVGWHHSDDPSHYAHLRYYEPLVHRFVSVSRCCAERLAEHLPHRSADIRHLPYAIMIPPGRRREPLTPERPLRLVYAGRMEQWQKRIFDFLPLVRGLDERGVHFEFRLVGYGSRGEELRRWLAAEAANFKNPKNRVWMEPPVTHSAIDDVWYWGDVSVLVSGFEGLSVSMLESMACGCVPVVTRIDSGVGEVVQEGRTGFTFPVGDIPQMIGHLQALRSNAGLLTKMSRAARAIVTEYCGYDRYLDRAMEIIDSTADLPPRAWPADRNVQMELPREFVLPDETFDRLRELLRDIAAEDAGPVAIFCAGKHTRALEEVWKQSPVEIAAVIDESARRGARLWGWPVVTPEQAVATGARAVIISSWVHEPAIWDRHHQAFEDAGLRMYCLYSSAPASAVATA
jgi:glycosyltransferase involved in cell wall biosynthesis